MRLAAALPAFAFALLLACEPRPATQLGRPATPMTPPSADRWWVEACGDAQPLGVMGHDVVPPQLVHRVDPQFRLPPATRGVIIIETVLTDRGDVCAARVLRGLTADMDGQALAAVKQWRFTPVMLNGQPRYAFYSLTVSVR